MAARHCVKHCGSYDFTLENNLNLVDAVLPISLVRNESYMANSEAEAEPDLQSRDFDSLLCSLAYLSPLVWV